MTVQDRFEMDIRGNARFFLLSKRMPITTLLEQSRDFLSLQPDMQINENGHDAGKATSIQDENFRTFS